MRVLQAYLEISIIISVRTRACISDRGLASSAVMHIVYAHTQPVAGVYRGRHCHTMRRTYIAFIIDICM